MHKKATKDVKEQLDAVEGPNEKIKFLQQKYLDKVHEANKLDKQNGTLQRSLDTSNREKDSLTQELARVNTVRFFALCASIETRLFNLPGRNTDQEEVGDFVQGADQAKQKRSRPIQASLLRGNGSFPSPCGG
eukprot:1853746-Rhodomonas_salina.1